ncbi:MAG: YqaE/Pmp3 family membrane protein [Magnetococcales bacterium]|nr:YqaE/Pmp3 family membrane protein [Magnetococcales bacterium]
MPPLGAFLQVGFTAQLGLNVLLVFLGWLPAVVHALWLQIERR